MLSDTGGLPVTRVALPQRGNVRAEMTHKKDVAEQRIFLHVCEEGCLLAGHAAVAIARAYE